MVILSGGTSKGAGDLCYRVVSRFTDPGIVVHGVALKPGKPLCLAVTGGKPVVVLPGFPTSAIFTFHEFVAPVIRAFAGLPPERRETIPATLPIRLTSERGRTEYSMVSLVRTDEGLAAYPIAKGSGSVTAFSHADGFVTIPQHQESVEAGTHGFRPADRARRRAGRPRRDRQPLRRPRPSAGRAAAARTIRQGAERRQHGRPDRRQARRMRSRPRPPDGPGDRPIQRTLPGPRPDAGSRLPPPPGHRLPQGRSPLRRPGRPAGADRRRQSPRLPDDQPQSRQRHPHPDRPPARRSEAPRLPGQAKSHNAVAAAVAQGRADWGVAIRP